MCDHTLFLNDKPARVEDSDALLLHRLTRKAAFLTVSALGHPNQGGDKGA